MWGQARDFLSLRACVCMCVSHNTPPPRVCVALSLQNPSKHSWAGHECPCASVRPTRGTAFARFNLQPRALHMSLISLNTSTCRGYPNHPSRSPIQKLHTASTRRTWGASKLISTTPSTRTAPERRGRSTATHTAVMDPSSAFTVPAAVFLGAARVTAAYAILFFGVLLWQASAKLRWAAHCQAKKESFDRYNDKRMLPYDRTVGNFMEWSVPFLCLFWLRWVLSLRPCSTSSSSRRPCRCSRWRGMMAW